MVHRSQSVGVYCGENQKTSSILQLYFCAVMLCELFCLQVFVATVYCLMYVGFQVSLVLTFPLIRRLARLSSAD